MLTRLSMLALFSALLFAQEEGAFLKLRVHPFQVDPANPDRGTVVVSGDAARVGSLDFEVAPVLPLRSIRVNGGQVLNESQKLVISASGRVGIFGLQFPQTELPRGEWLSFAIERSDSTPWPETPLMLAGGIGATLQGNPVPVEVEYLSPPAASNLVLSLSKNRLKLGGMLVMGRPLPKISGGNRCDIDGNNTVNVLDVTRCVNMFLGIEPCTLDIAGPGNCNALAIQRLVNATFDQNCRTDPYIELTWVASTTPNVDGYNIFRNASCIESWTQSNSSLVQGTQFFVYPLTSGASYCFAAKAVKAGQSSDYSNTAGPVFVP